MKNLKRLLGLMAISGFAFGFAGNVKAETTISADVCKNTENSRVYVQSENGASYGCFGSISSAMNDSNVKKGSIIVLLENYNNTVSPVTINKDVTLDLNGHTFTAGDTNGYISVGNDVDFTIRNGKLAAATGAANIIKVTNSSATNSLTIAKDVTVVGTNLTAAVIDGSGITSDTTVNINGTWTNIDKEIIDCNVLAGQYASSAANLTVNLNATVTGGATLVGIDAGHSVVNVNGGSYTATNGYVFNVSNGTLNIKDGTLLAKNGDALFINETAAKQGDDINVNISGGTITASATDKYSIHFGAFANKGTYSISKGTFTSGKDADGKQLPAIKVSDWSFIDNQGDIISGGKFVGSIVDEVRTGDNTYYTAKSAADTLVKGTYTEKDGNVTVGETPTTDPGTTPDPENPGPGAGDVVPGGNTQTYDGILSYVTLAISSLGALGFATKKVLF